MIILQCEQEKGIVQHPFFSFFLKQGKKGKWIVIDFNDILNNLIRNTNKAIAKVINRTSTHVIIFQFEQRMDNTHVSHFS